MTGPNDDVTDEDRCPVCGRPVGDGDYPRHRLVLEGENGERHARHVCPACWEDLREAFSSRLRPSDE